MFSSRYGWLSIGLLCLLLGSASGQVTTIKPRAEQLLGSWQSKAQMKQTDIEMRMEGEKRFVSTKLVEDRLTGAFVFTKRTTVPILISIDLQSDWMLKGDHLCERLKTFRIGVLSKPDDAVLPDLLVQHLVQNLQKQYGEQHKSGRESCNQIVNIESKRFVLRDGRSTRVTSFTRAK